MRRIFKGFIAFTVICAGFVGGFSLDSLQSLTRKPDSAVVGLRLLPAKLALLLQPSAARAQGERSLSPVDTYFTVMDTIRGDFYGPTPAPSATKLTYTAIRGMLKTLNDPYTSFWTPEEFQKQMEDARGDFVGIGAVLDMTRDKKVLIVEPIEGSPASKQGILPGDIIVKVDGKPILGLDLTEVVNRIRGERGTKVTLSLLRKGRSQLLDITITRAQVNSPVITYRMQDPAAKIGYIQLKGFNERADQQFIAALQKLEAQGMKALIFDLRNNPGGLLNVARDIASRFIEKGPLVWVQEKNGNRTSLNVDPKKHQSHLDRGEYPVIVLVNGFSASASEIVAGAIQDYGVGTLVGTTTFGKGMVQTIIPLSDNSALKVTTQRYFTPKLNDINKKVDESGKQTSGGITPDIVVELTEKDTEALREAMRTNPEAAHTLRDDIRFDPQMRKALEVAREKIAGKSVPTAAQANAR